VITFDIKDFICIITDEACYQFYCEKLTVHTHVLSLLQRFLIRLNWNCNKKVETSVSLFVGCVNQKSSLRSRDMRIYYIIFDYIRRITPVSPRISQKT
jgi:hypothetical protein